MLSDGIQHLHAHLIPRYPFTDLDRVSFRNIFIQRDGLEEVEKQIKNGKLGGFWYMGLRERNWKDSEFGVKPPDKRARFLEDLSKQLRMEDTI